VHLASGRVDVRTLDRVFACDVELTLVVDRTPYPLVFHAGEVKFDGKEALRGDVVLESGGRRLPVSVHIAVDRGHDALMVRAELAAEVAESEHWRPTLALRAELAIEGAPLFVAGVGDVADVADVAGAAAVLAYEPHSLALTSSFGSVDVRVRGDGDAPSPMRVAVTSPVARTDSEPSRADLRLLVGASGSRLFRSIFSARGLETKRVHGRVTGAAPHEHARVFGVDVAGAPCVRTLTDDAGSFELEVPREVVAYYASVEGGRASEPARFVAGTDAALTLDVPPGGDMRVTVTDADTHAPLTARLFFHGIEGTVDPSFGPDYRAAGAGPLIDALRGAATTPLAPGRYRVSASKGIEWSIDAREVTLETAQRVDVALALRHVVPTPGLVGCDLHVHARPSFDTPVTTQDRVLSLVAAGVDFAVPTEHNLIGDYGPALGLLDLTGNLAWVPGVEVTTYSPRIGHFGVFPYPKAPVPPYRSTTAAAILAAARRTDPTRVVQVNHPRMGYGIGYFEVKHFAPGAGHAPPGMTTNFDAIEVYNGYDLGAPERVATVMRDWFALLNSGSHIVGTGSSDAHRIQYNWAGYPRSFVAVGPDADLPGHKLDTNAVVAAIKAGRVTVSSGPLVELTVGDAVVGDTVTTTAEHVRARVRVHAAPWVDVTSVEILVGGKLVRAFPIASRPTYVGPELGTLKEAETRTLRFDDEIDVPINIPSDARTNSTHTSFTWVCAIARGARTMDDVLPFMPFLPFGFTNPIWIRRPLRQ
jgi:hypothetical protein